MALELTECKIRYQTELFDFLRYFLSDIIDFDCDLSLLNTNSIHPLASPNISAWYPLNTIVQHERH